MISLHITGTRVMKQQKVDIFNIQFLKSFVDSRFRVCELIRIQLCRYKYFFPWNTGIPDGLADTFLIIVRLYLLYSFSVRWFSWKIA